MFFGINNIFLNICGNSAKLLFLFNNLNNKFTHKDFDYSYHTGPFLKWTREEHQQMDQSIKNSWQCIRTYIPRFDLYRLWVIKTRRRTRQHWRERRYIDKTTRRLHKKNKERLITARRNITNNASISRLTIYRKNKWKKKAIVLIFQATNKRNFTREDLDMIKKRKP